MAGDGMMFSSSKSGTTPTIRRGSMLMPINFITPSVHRRSRFTASCPGNSVCARLWLTITTRSEPSLSVSLKSRPSRIGMPSVAKYPGDIDRNFARQSSRPFFRAAPCAANVKLMSSPCSSRHGTLKPVDTWATPGSALTRRCTS